MVGAGDGDDSGAEGSATLQGTSPGGQDWRKPSLSVDGSAQSDAKPEESEPNVDRGGLALGCFCFARTD